MDAIEQIRDAIKAGATSLKIEDGKIDNLPTEIGELTSLVSLEINCRCITTLPVDIGKLVNLTNLVINCAAVNSLPVEIYKLINLTRLDISSSSPHFSFRGDQPFCKPDLV